MPSYITTESNLRIGETIEAIICDIGAREAGVPVRVQLVSERVLAVDGEPHRIIQSVGGDGRLTVTIEGSSKSLRNRERRIALARASALLQQLQASLKPLVAGSEAPEHVTEALGLLYGWLAQERDDATTGPPRSGAEGARDDYA